MTGMTDEKFNFSIETLQSTKTFLDLSLLLLQYLYNLGFLEYGFSDAPHKFPLEKNVTKEIFFFISLQYIE
jgi:hypothetical protein